MLAEDRSEGILGILSLSLAKVCSNVESVLTQKVWSETIKHAVRFRAVIINRALDFYDGITSRLLDH